MAGAGVPLALGSDAPVTALGPWAAVRAAVHPHEAGHGLDPATAFAAHCAGGWAAAGLAGGELAAGRAATFALWDAELEPATGLPDLSAAAELPRCLATVRDGVAIHDTGGLDGDA
jgi:hypothetical protein